MSVVPKFRTIRFQTNEQCCPFGSRESEICSASLSSMVIDTSRRRAYCNGDDYDSCPIFLASMLRKNRQDHGSQMGMQIDVMEKTIV